VEDVGVQDPFTTRVPTARPRPAIDGDNEHFWLGGKLGKLQLKRCADCGHWLHPPLPICPICLSRNVVVEAVSGLGSIDSFTINYQAWHPMMPPPYIIGLVGLDEQPGLRITSNIYGCRTDEISVGMRVAVEFEERNGIWYPIFRPIEASA
jgi:uncharacterized OB-fold protein